MSLFLGTNYGHGSAAAVMSENGELIFAIEEERLIGDKETSQFPIESIKSIAENVKGDIKFWAEGWNINDRLLYKGVISTLKYGFSNPIYFNHRLIKELKRYSSGLPFYNNLFPNRTTKKVSLVGHHLAHSYSLLPWGLPPKSLIVVSDTTGEKESISSYYWSGNEMILLSKSKYPNSIGSLYHQLAYHLGFQGRTGPGKLMALSAYGNPVWYELLKELYKIEKGVLSIDIKKYPAWRIDKTWLHFSRHQKDTTFRNEILSSFQNYEAGKDIAASAQKWFTETTFEYILESLKIARDIFFFEVDYLGLAGGAALNCQANGEIVRRIPANGIKEIFVSPWSDDPGTAIGAAVWMLHEVKPNVEIKKASPLLGVKISPSKILCTNHDIEAAVKALMDENVVALASGALEFGPRALGGRCLLADAREKNLVDILNKIKDRPSFMPFAPVVLKEDYFSFFDGVGSTNMAWTVLATPRAKTMVPGAIHISGEARVQVVEDETTLLYRVLKEYKRRVGFGLLLLTSLNGRGDAIPATMEQVISMIKKLKIKGLLTDDGWVINF